MGLTTKLRLLGRRPVWAFFLALILMTALTMMYLGYQVVTLPMDKESLLDKGQVSILEEKLHRLESELKRNNEVLDTLSQNIEKIQQPNVLQIANPLTQRPPLNFKDLKSSFKKFPNASRVAQMAKYVGCPPQALAAPRVDVKMVDFYENLSFDNFDGGSWKQGWEISYSEDQWNDNSKLRIFVVPHSHNDPGWLKTFEKYYIDHTRHIFDNMVKKLAEDSRRKFIWAEISFLSLWWERSTLDDRTLLKRFVENGQLELVTGGWVMNDEAVTHYFAMIEQLVEGHEWMHNHLGVKAENGWAIDPFGLSPTMPYILKRTGFQHMVIQRVHYSVKKQLARDKGLEFLWRQHWDRQNTTDIFCHMMPFYSYDVPHSCGPDPKICCQFDFKRLPGGKVNCPWKIAPQPIVSQNIKERATVLLDQYRKKAQLYRTNVIMVPLGDDFRYDKAIEWDQQYMNYQLLFDYMNKQTDWNVQAQFGTLHDFFNALEDGQGVHNAQGDVTFDGFPSLTGDFFTYADRDDHYWSGYFTSRPLYKNMDRVLEAYVRAGEIMFSSLLAYQSTHGTSSNIQSSSLLQQLVDARRNLGLFQHHDAITGTSRDHVVVDFGIRLLQSITQLQNVIGKAAAVLLFPPDRESESAVVEFDLDDYRASHSSMSKKTLIEILPVGRTVVFHNSLGHTRRELVSLVVSTPRIRILDPTGQDIPIQVNPVWSGPDVHEDQFEVFFEVEVPPFGLAVHKLEITSKDPENYLVYSLPKITIINGAIPPPAKQYPWEFQVGKDNDYVLWNNAITATFSSSGLLKAITTLRDNVTHAASLSFVKYGTRTHKDRSGAYLFLPGGEAQSVTVERPYVRILEGLLLSEVHVSLPYVEHTVWLKRTLGFDGLGLDVFNVVDISKEKNFELTMRVETGISNGRDFYTDANGFQMVHRRTLDKLPTQANYYPVSMAAFIEDSSTRFTILTAQPLGGASLQPGWLELILDRRLNQDDNRGMQQGVLDNKPTPSHFRFLVEKKLENVETDSLDEVVLPSMASHLASQSLLYPILRLIMVEPNASPVLTNVLPTFSIIDEDLPCDVHLLNLRTLVNENLDDQEKFSPKNACLLLLHRLGVDCNIQAPKLSCLFSQGQFNFSRVLSRYFQNEVIQTSLTALYDYKTFTKSDVVDLKPMEISAFKLFR